MSSAPIALVGSRCVGKSTLGRALAEVLDVSFVDLDDLLAAEQGVASAGTLLADVGEPRFRELESEALARLLDEGPAPGVLATGGGIVETPTARRLLRERARTVWLQAPLALLEERLRADPTPRPSLTGAHPADELGVLLARRGPLWAEAAALTLEVGSLPPELAVERLVEALG